MGGGGKCYFDHGASDARGAAVLINPKFALQVQKVEISGNGNYVILNGLLNEKEIMLVNIYAPNEKSLEFYAPLLDKLIPTSPDWLICGGDLNVHLNPELDKKGGKEVKRTKSAELINMFLEDNDWIDVWRHLNPNRFQYTYKCRTPLVMTRLDYFLVPLATLHSVISCQIIPGFLSDHCFVELELQIQNVIRGPGLWKLNNSLLTDQDYVSEINSIIRKSEQQLQAGLNDPVGIWESMKFQVQQFSIQFSKERARLKRSKVEQLTKHLTALEKRLEMINLKSDSAVRLIQEINVKIDKVKLELNDEIHYKMQGAILRSKMRWYCEGEHGTKYFLMLERNKARNKQMGAAKRHDGTVTRDTLQILNEQKKFYQQLYKSDNSVKFQYTNTDDPVVSSNQKEVLQKKIEVQ